MEWIGAVVVIVAIVFGCLTGMVAIYFENRTKLEMLKRGYVPKDYQAINQQAPLQPQPQPQPPQPGPRYELPQLPEQGAPMPFSTGDSAKVQANLYDLPTTNISPPRR